MKTYGSVDFVPPSATQDYRGCSVPLPGFWRIECEPHVMILLKRLFDGINKHVVGHVRMGDTPKNAFDLGWFLTRYPMQLSPAASEWLERRTREHEARAALVQQVLGEEYTPPVFAMSKPARDYQAREADLCLRGRSLLVADDVGLGKTITAAALFTDPRVRPALYVTLTHLPKQMKEKFEEFIPGVSVHILKSGIPYDLTVGPRGAKVRFPDIIIANYHKLSGWKETLASVIKSVVFDEVQELRTGVVSDKGSAARALAEAAEYRMGLTATPVYNYGDEMYNIMNVIAPGCLGAWDEFLREWCVKASASHHKIKEPKAFGTWLRESGFYVRHTRKSVGRELPRCDIQPHVIEADLAALDKVKPEAAELAKVILAQDGFSNFDKMRAAGDLDMRLRQATGLAKSRYVASFVRMVAESGEKVVLYGWHRAVYDIWMSELADLKPVLYTGSESPTQKDKAKDAFVKGDSQVMIISLRAGAGLDGLQHVCNTVVFGELDWSPGVHTQNIGRVHRDGQKDPVAAFFLLAEHGSDPVIADVLQIKNMQLEGIQDPNAELVEELQVDVDRIKLLAQKYLAKQSF